MLPKTASIRWSNGDTTDEAVTWDAVDAASYAQAGTFKARGTVAGQTVYCTVNVAARNAVVQTGDNSVPVAAIVAGAVAGRGDYRGSRRPHRPCPQERQVDKQRPTERRPPRPTILDGKAPGSPVKGVSRRFSFKAESSQTFNA